MIIYVTAGPLIALLNNLYGHFVLMHTEGDTFHKKRSFQHRYQRLAKQMTIAFRHTGLLPLSPVKQSRLRAIGNHLAFSFRNLLQSSLLASSIRKSASSLSLALPWFAQKNLHPSGSICFGQNFLQPVCQ